MKNLILLITLIVIASMNYSQAEKKEDFYKTPKDIKKLVVKLTK